MATQLLDEVFENAVRTVVAESPDHVYRKHKVTVGEFETPEISASCRYVFNGMADCVIGQALVRAGVPVTELDILEHDAAKRDSLQANEFLFIFGLSVGTRQWASAIQGKQDCGYEWGRALEDADAWRRSEAEPETARDFATV